MNIFGRNYTEEEIEEGKRMARALVEKLNDFENRILELTDEEIEEWADVCTEARGFSSEFYALAGIDKRSILEFIDKE